MVGCYECTEQEPSRRLARGAVLLIKWNQGISIDQLRDSLRLTRLKKVSTHEDTTTGQVVRKSCGCEPHKPPSGDPNGGHDPLSFKVIGDPVQATEHGSTRKGGCTSGTPDKESRALSGESIQVTVYASTSKGNRAKDRGHDPLSLSVIPGPSKLPSMVRQARGAAPAEHQMERAGLSLASLFPKSSMVRQGREQCQRQRAWSSLFTGEPVRATDHDSTRDGGCTSATPDVEIMTLYR
jgi:hypothetical protein